MGSQIRECRSRRARLSTMASLLASSAARAQPFTLLQSSTAQSCVDILRYTLTEATSKGDGCAVLFSLLYPPSVLLERDQPSSDRLHVLDWTRKVPGYNEDDFDLNSDMLEQVSTGACHAYDLLCSILKGRSSSFRPIGRRR